MFSRALFFVSAIVLSLSAYTSTERVFPQNIRFDSSMVYVKAGDSAYTKMFSFAGQAWRIGKIAIKDTNIVKQDTLNIGWMTTGGVKIKQEICFPTGNRMGFGTDYDTLCTVCGDTNRVAFTNSPGLSNDSSICLAIDTTKMVKKNLGGDTIWVSKGYFSMQPDPAPWTRFKVIGNSGFGATVKRVILMIWSFDGVPVETIK